MPIALNDSVEFVVQVLASRLGRCQRQCQIAFSWRKGDHAKRGRFFPDFFLMLKNQSEVLVVETKTDDDDSDENRAKLKFASEHSTD